MKISVGLGVGDEGMEVMGGLGNGRMGDCYGVWGSGDGNMMGMRGWGWDGFYDGLAGEWAKGFVSIVQSSEN